MCNLYSMTRTRAEVGRLFRVTDNCSAFEPRDAIFASHVAPIVRTADGEREVVTMSWGFVLPQPGKAPRRVTNTRDDKVLTSRFWTPSFRERRCLVPASSFCEPHDGMTPSTWHWFALKGNEPRPLFAFTGIWCRHKGPIKKDGPVVEIETFSFMTTVPNGATASINHERSPVLLTTETERDTWLNASPDIALQLVKPIAADRLAIVQEGFDKHDRVA